MARSYRGIKNHIVHDGLTQESGVDECTDLYGSDHAQTATKVDFTFQPDHGVYSRHRADIPRTAESTIISTTEKLAEVYAEQLTKANNKLKNCSAESQKCTTRRGPLSQHSEVRNGKDIQLPEWMSSCVREWNHYSKRKIASMK
jgi:hypothetical protein